MSDHSLMGESLSAGKISLHTQCQTLRASIPHGFWLSKEEGVRIIPCWVKGSTLIYEKLQPKDHFPTITGGPELSRLHT